MDNVIRESFLRLADYVTSGEINGSSSSSNTGNTLDKYSIAREDTESTVGREFYGFLAIDGSWYILDIDLVNGTYHYANGTNGTFDAAWSNAQNGTLITTEFNNLSW